MNVMADFEMFMYEANMYYSKGNEFEHENDYLNAKEFYLKAYEIYKTAYHLANNINDELMKVRAKNAFKNTFILYNKMVYKQRLKEESQSK